MSAFFIIDCSCGNSTSARKTALLANPSGQVICRGLTKEGPCGRPFLNTTLIKAIERGEEVYKAQEPQQLKLGER